MGNAASSRHSYPVFSLPADLETVDPESNKHVKMLHIIFSPKSNEMLPYPFRQSLSPRR